MESVEPATSLNGWVLRPALPAHQQSDGLQVGIFGLEGAHDAAFVDDRDAVRQVEQFVELFGNKDDGDAGIAQFDKIAQHRVDRTDV